MKRYVLFGLVVGLLARPVVPADLSWYQQARPGFQFIYYGRCPDCVPLEVPVGGKRIDA